MKLTYKVFFNKTFDEAIKYISDQWFSKELCSQICDLMYEIEENGKKYSKLFNNLQKGYAIKSKDKDGKPVDIINPEKFEEYFEEQGKLLETEFEIDLDKKIILPDKVKKDGKEVDLDLKPKYLYSIKEIFTIGN